jgi:hypothetical protein
MLELLQRLGVAGPGALRTACCVLLLCGCGAPGGAGAGTDSGGRDSAGKDSAGPAPADPALAERGTPLPAAEAAAQPAPPEDVADTVESLLQILAASRLTFLRNGAEHSGAEAAVHIRAKYDRIRDAVRTPEEFIERAATKSLLTGRPYLVQLADGSRQPLADWLHARLAEVRAARDDTARQGPLGSRSGEG